MKEFVAKDFSDIRDSAFGVGRSAFSFHEAVTPAGDRYRFIRIAFS
jgi:hypothetical protein